MVGRLDTMSIPSEIDWSLSICYCTLSWKLKIDIRIKWLNTQENIRNTAIIFYNSYDTFWYLDNNPNIHLFEINMRVNSEYTLKGNFTLPFCKANDDNYFTYFCSSGKHLKNIIKNNVKKSDDIMLKNSPYQKLFCSLHSLVDDEIISEMNCL